MGVGHLSIKCKEGEKKATKDSKPTIIIRNDVCHSIFNAFAMKFNFDNLLSSELMGQFVI